MTDPASTIWTVAIIVALIAAYAACVWVSRPRKPRPDLRSDEYRTTYRNGERPR